MCVCVLGHLPMLERAASNDEYVSVCGGGDLPVLEQAVSNDAESVYVCMCVGAPAFAGESSE
jgi:hypothetical protein